MIKHFKAVLLEKKNLTSDIWELRFQPDQEVPFQAGQYMILKVGDKRRLYSISSADFLLDHFTLLVQLLPDGVGSNFFRDLLVGQTADFMGPAGQFVLRDFSLPKIILATGTGIAPICSMVETLLKDSKDDVKNPGGELSEVVLFWGLKTLKDSYYIEDYLEKMKNHPNFKFYLCLTRELNEFLFEQPHIKKGRINEVLTRFMHGHSDAFPSEYEYLICGSREMVTSTLEFLLSKKIRKERIYFEKF
jgi:NAD(P)H-flavin reductase